MAHANDSTPDPITAVIMCDVAVQNVPANSQHIKKGYDDCYPLLLEINYISSSLYDEKINPKLDRTIVG